MLDSFDQDSVLNGAWEGYYDYDNKHYSAKNFPISATLLQAGKSFHGIMIDGITDTEVPFRRLVEAYQDRMSERARRRAHLTLQQFPDLCYESSLPEESRLAGKIVGNAIRFTKTYIGPYNVVQVVGSDRVLVQSINNHRVEYRGVLSLENAAIEGRWVIRWRGLLGRILPPQNSGGFTLFMKQ